MYSRSTSKMTYFIRLHSLQAGADNCFFDAFTNGIARQLRPLFTAMGQTLDVRNGGHNGGIPVNYQLMCASSILGADADIIIHQSPFVRAGDPFVEDLTRRCVRSRPRCRLRPLSPKWTPPRGGSACEPARALVVAITPPLRWNKTIVPLFSTCLWLPRC